MRKWFLSQLLPYDPKIKVESRLKNGLNEYLLLLVASEEAMICFLEGKLHKFDPLVGENSCQIRAIRVALIASKNSVNPVSVVEKVRESKKIILHLIESVREAAVQSKSLKHFLEYYNVDVFLDEESIFLIKSYILSKVKVLDESKRDLWKNEKTVSKKIKEFAPVGSTFADDLIRWLREQLSKSSAAFVQEIAASSFLAGDNTEEIIRKFSIYHNGLYSTPFYWMTKVILHQALKSSIPIVIFAEQLAKDLDNKVLEKTTLFFDPTESGYQVASKEMFSLDQPVMVFTVASCRNVCDFSSREDWEKELTEVQLEELVLACNAAHKQCPEPEVENLLLEMGDEKFLYHLQKSQEWGCHLENPFRFILRHIYCDVIKNI